MQLSIETEDTRNATISKFSINQTGMVEMEMWDGIETAVCRSNLGTEYLIEFLETALKLMKNEK